MIARCFALAVQNTPESFSGRWIKLPEFENTKKQEFPALHPAGDCGLLLEFGANYDPQINNAVTAFDAEFSQILPDGVIETARTFRSLMIRFDPFVMEFQRLKELVLQLLHSQNWYEAAAPSNRREWLLPVTYGQDFGRDIAETADLMGLREDQVADEHAAQILNVAMIGFSPGLAYLGQLPKMWNLPRKTDLSAEVPAGSILVAVRQTVLPATAIPTGWRQIGQTPFRSFQPNLKQPFLLQPGDVVRFEQISAGKFNTIDPEDCLREVPG